MANYKCARCDLPLVNGVPVITKRNPFDRTMVEFYHVDEKLCQQVIDQRATRATETEGEQ